MASAEGQLLCPTCGASYPPATARCPADGTTLVRVTAPADPLIGLELDGRYTLRQRLGAGGMGTVYRALQHSVGRDVAIKVIQRGRIDETSVKRFMREAKLAASISQPNVVPVLEFGQTGEGMLYLVMELCAGRTLHQLIRAEGPLPPDRVVRIAVQLCDALEAAHARGIIHRDLKPANVIVLDEPAGRDLLKVLDFGLARSMTGADEHGPLTSSGVLVGTPNYVSPEEILGTAIDHRADLYALGAVMYEMVNREAPFSNEGGASVIFERQARGDVRPFARPVPPGLERLIRRLLERSPDARPKSAADVRTLLLEYQDAPGASSLVQSVGSSSVQSVGSSSVHSVGSSSVQGVGSPSAHPVGSPSAHPVGSPSAHPVGSPSAHPVGSSSVHSVGSPSGHPGPAPTVHPGPAPTVHPEPVEGAARWPVALGLAALTLLGAAGAWFFFPAAPPPTPVAPRAVVVPAPAPVPAPTPTPVAAPAPAPPTAKPAPAHPKNPDLVRELTP